MTKRSGKTTSVFYLFHLVSIDWGVTSKGRKDRCMLPFLSVYCWWKLFTSKVFNQCSFTLNFLKLWALELWAVDYDWTNLNSFKIEIKYTAKIIWHNYMYDCYNFVLPWDVFTHSIKMAKVKFFYYNQTFWSYGDMISSGKWTEKGYLVAQNLPPFYIHDSPLPFLP